MTDPRTEITSLKGKVADLEARLEQLNEKYQRSVNGLMGLHDVLNKHRMRMDAESDDAFERIKNIELALFPRLIRDMRHLYSVIGDHEPKAYNPLDFRDRSKKSR